MLVLVLSVPVVLLGVGDRFPGSVGGGMPNAVFRLIMLAFASGLEPIGRGNVKLTALEGGSVGVLPPFAMKFSGGSSSNLSVIAMRDCIFFSSSSGMETFNENVDPLEDGVETFVEREAILDIDFFEASDACLSLLLIGNTFEAFNSGDPG